MRNTISKQDKRVNRNLSEWDKAIADAKKGIARLRAALAHAEEMKATGEPWPGEEVNKRATTQVDSQNDESCHGV